MKRRQNWKTLNPSLPQPRVKRGPESFDLVAVKLPCDRWGAGPGMSPGCTCSLQQPNWLLTLRHSVSFFSPIASLFPTFSPAEISWGTKGIFGCTSLNQRHWRRSFGFRLGHANLQSHMKRKVSRSTTCLWELCACTAINELSGRFTSCSPLRARSADLHGGRETRSICYDTALGRALRVRSDRGSPKPSLVGICEGSRHPRG